MILFPWLQLQEQPQTSVLGVRPTSHPVSPPKVPKASPRWDTSKWRWWQKQSSHDADTCPRGQAAAQAHFVLLLLLLWLIHFCTCWPEGAMKGEQEVELGR